MDEIVIDVAPVHRWQSAMRALARRDLPSPAGVRRRIEEQGEDPVRAAVSYLETVVSGALDAAIDDLDSAALGRALLAEELLLILTGSDDDDVVRAWLQRGEPGHPAREGRRGR
ncbi:MAG: hypothetical protein GY719_27625 [bacterium]|nr:hypothetical protein [bacterium]